MCSLFSGGGSETGERQHCCHVAHVGLVHVHGAAELALARGGLLGEDMAAVCVATLVFSGSGLPEALGSSAVGLDLGHWKSFAVFLITDLGGGFGHTCRLALGLLVSH